MHSGGFSVHKRGCHRTLRQAVLNLDLRVTDIAVYCDIFKNFIEIFYQFSSVGRIFEVFISGFVLSSRIIVALAVRVIGKANQIVIVGAFSVCKDVI